MTRPPRHTLLLTLLLVGCAGTEVQPQTNEWIQLFNGEDLAEWTPKFSGFELGENLHNTFRVEDGILKVSYNDYEGFDGEFGHLFYEQPFSNYRLRVEYRFVGDQVRGGPGWAMRNNGLMLHCQPPQTMELDQDFPHSLEMQLLGGNGRGSRPTANVCTPGTHIVMDGVLVTRHCTNSTSKTYDGDQWVVVEVEVRGSTVINHIVEGETVLSFTEPQLDDEAAQDLSVGPGESRLLSSGYISLQAESHPTEFRRIELLRLDN